MSSAVKHIVSSSASLVHDGGVIVELHLVKLHSCCAFESTHSNVHALSSGAQSRLDRVWKWNWNAIIKIKSSHYCTLCINSHNCRVHFMRGTAD
jgi:hypothetical protein